ncbi:lipopolysaccharide export system permease protein [Parelusimicrobium proximum]|uniref:LptF/LptG family permease n=1 Tax=Parelusimicrobium proximum TaxID=3228953 RepID=UPI003D182EDE
MKILFRYIAGKFWPPFLFAFSIFSALFLIGDIFENIKTISTGTGTFALVLKYAAMRLPFYASSFLVPLSCLLASIYVITDLISSGEWTACLASGHRPMQIFAPVLACVLLVVVLAFANQELFVTGLKERSVELEQVQLKGKTDFNIDLVHNSTMKLPGNILLYAKTIDTASGIMSDINADEYNDDWTLKKQYIAETLSWENGHWIMHNGIERTFPDALTVSERPFETHTADFITIAKKDMQVDVNSAEDSNIATLIKKISFLTRSGLASHQERTNLHNKLAMPFLSVLMCMLAMPLVMVVGRKSKALNIISALIVAFAFWTLLNLMTTAGETGAINPIAAGWTSVWLCLGIVIFEYKKMRI